MAQKLYFWAWVLQFGKAKVRFLPFFLFFIIILGGNLNVTARKPGCIHHLTLFLLAWLVREFPVCRKGLCFGKNYLFQVDWSTICCIWQSEWNKVQEVFVAAREEILSNLTFMMFKVSVLTKGHVLTFPADSSSGCSAPSSSMGIYDFMRNSLPFFRAASCSGPSLKCVLSLRDCLRNWTKPHIFCFFLSSFR